MAEFKIGDEVDVRFDRSIVTAVHPHGAHGCSLTVQTADAEFTFDVFAADTSVRKTGVRHDLRRCPQCSHPSAKCAHRDQYALDDLDTETNPSGGPS